MLDTHLLLWALGQLAKLLAAAREQIEKSDVYVSVASIREISHSEA
jgi:PIN domain nuclease of toxin-antitoxin system